ncbi:uncharacterized protein LOC141969450 isoform X1 [Athene noctua]|uniref:uncharacterized protein LOC141969450 isoform X1 n=1 Tax=Athene noctua TaxID=126797 RepID=UPI003EBEC114
MLAPVARRALQFLCARFPGSVAPGRAAQPKGRVCGGFPRAARGSPGRGVPLVRGRACAAGGGAPAGPIRGSNGPCCYRRCPSSRGRACPFLPRPAPSRGCRRLRPARAGVRCLCPARRFSRLGGQKGRAEPCRPRAAGGSRRGWSWRGRRKGRKENIEGMWAAAAWPCGRRAPASPGEDWSHGRRREERRSEVVNFPGSAESDGCGTASDNGSSVDSGASVLQKTHRKPETRKHPSRPMRLLRKTAMALQKLSVIGPPGFQKENL